MHHSRGISSRYEQVVRQLYHINAFVPVKLNLENVERLHEAMGSPLAKLIPNRLKNQENLPNNFCLKSDSKPLMSDVENNHISTQRNKILCESYSSSLDISSKVNEKMTNMKIVHVAGTNGKGSVATKIAKALENSNYRTGLYTSPHISSFRERMQINSVPISEEEIVDILPKIFDACEKHKIEATFFEITTCIAFEHFSRHNVDAMVLEVGIGGRLDATNIVSPSLSIITSIGLDHTNILGNTIEEIATEKAGIIKPSKSVVLGTNLPYDYIKDIAVARGAPILQLLELEEEDYIKTVPQNGQMSIDGTNDTIDLTTKPLFDQFDIENMRITKTACNYLVTQLGFEIPHEALQQALYARPPCRFEIISKEIKVNDFANQKEVKVEVPIILDVGHNQPALDYMFRKLTSQYPSSSGYTYRILIGLSKDKHIQLCLEKVKEYIQDGKMIHFVQASHPRAVNTKELTEEAKEIGLLVPNENKSYESVSDGIKDALKMTAEAINNKQKEVLIICGTFFIMAEAREALGIVEAHDSKIIEEVNGTQYKYAQEIFGPPSPIKR